MFPAIIEEEFDSELDEVNSLEKFDEEVIQKSVFDFQEAFIIGGMIVGQAYEEGLDEKEVIKKKSWIGDLGRGGILTISLETFQILFILLFNE